MNNTNIGLSPIKDMSPLETSVDGLKRRIEGLGEVVRSLEARLSPVSRRIEKPEVKLKEMVASPGQSEVVKTIHNLEGAVTLLETKLYDIISELEV